MFEHELLSFNLGKATLLCVRNLYVRNSLDLLKKNNKEDRGNIDFCVQERGALAGGRRGVSTWYPARQVHAYVVLSPLIRKTTRTQQGYKDCKAWPGNKSCLRPKTSKKWSKHFQIDCFWLRQSERRGPCFADSALPIRIWGRWL